jgi:hypothetical protein
MKTIAVGVLIFIGSLLALPALGGPFAVTPSGIFYERDYITLPGGIFTPGTTISKSTMSFPNVAPQTTIKQVYTSGTQRITVTKTLTDYRTVTKTELKYVYLRTTVTETRTVQAGTVTVTVTKEVPGVFTATETKIVNGPTTTVTVTETKEGTTTTVTTTVTAQPGGSLLRGELPSPATLAVSALLAAGGMLVVRRR